MPQGSSYVTTRIIYARGTDIPVVGDWNGDGKSELGVWRPSTAQYIERTSAGGVTGSYVSKVLVLGIPRG